MSTSGSSGSTPQLSVLLPADTAQKELSMQAGEGASAISASCVSLALHHHHYSFPLIVIVQEMATASSIMLDKGITPLSTSKLANQSYPKVSAPYFFLQTWNAQSFL
jgi:hypothetical protein